MAKDKSVKKDKSAKKDKVQKEVVIAIDNSTIADCTSAKIVKVLEDTAKLETTPAGDYFVDTTSGRIRVRKSEGGRVSWQLDEKQITRPNLYKATKDGAPVVAEEVESDKKDKKDKKKKEKEGEESSDTGKKKGKKEKKEKESKDEEVDGPSKAQTSKVYKKKELLNVLTNLQIFKKGIIKKVKTAIEEKNIAGSAFISILDDVTGKETAIEDINRIFEALNE